MLDIHVSLLLLVLVVFLIMIMLLNKWLYAPLLTFMDERDRSIQEDLENASSASSDAQALKEEANKILSDAKNEAASMRQQTIEESKLTASTKVDARRSELDATFEMFKSELKKEEESLRSALLSQLPLYRELLKAKFAKLGG